MSELTPFYQRAAGKEDAAALLELPPTDFGRPRAPAGTWASCIRIIDPVEPRTVAMIPIDNNESAFSIAVVHFAARGGEPHLVVGTAQDTIVSPRGCTSGFLRTYKFTNEGAGLELLHKTETEDVPLAVLGFQGRLAAGVGKALRLYDIGKKKLLRKVENKVRMNFLHITAPKLTFGADVWLWYRYTEYPRLTTHCR
jgi:splicing factor 3B subunit 3